MRVAR